MNNKRTFFTHTPYTGYFKYKDQIHIYPAQKETEYHIRHKPAIIEFTTNEAPQEFFEDTELPKDIKFPVPQDFVQNFFNQNRYEEILRLLSLLTNYFHFNYKSKQSWFMPIDPKKHDYPSVIWGQEMVPKVDGIFIESTFSEVEKKESLNYYGDNLFQRDTNTVIYPDSIEKLLDKYFKLSESDKQALDKSIRLFNQRLSFKYYNEIAGDSDIYFFDRKCHNS